MGKFGWDLPPGCTMRDVENAYGQEEPCELCGRFCDDCTCPECFVCGVVGDKKCYAEHGMCFSHEQLTYLTKAS